MRQLLPEPVAEVDPAEVYGSARRQPPGDRPWVMANMVMSIDGGTTVAGRSGALSGPSDRAVFRLLRSLADVVLVGAATVRAEGYGPGRGTDPPAIAVVSASLDLAPSLPLFTAAVRPTVVLTTAAADPGRRAALAEVAEVEVAGETAVDVGTAVAALGRRGHRLVLCEGGPVLLGQVVEAELLDELCLTMSPVLAGGPGPRLLGPGSSVAVQPRRLVTLLEDEGMLFARYLA